MLNLEKIKQKLNVIWTDFIYFLNIFKISKGINSFILEDVLDDFRFSFNLMSSHKLILVPYAIFLFITGYYIPFHEYLSQSNIILSFTLISITLCVAFLAFSLMYLPLVMLTWFLVSMALKSMFNSFSSSLASIITVSLVIYSLLKHSIKIDSSFRWFIVDTYIIMIITIIITALIVRRNVNNLYKQEPQRVKGNFILKFFKFNNSIADKSIRIICILFVIPFLVFQTTSYKVILFDFLRVTNQITINNPIPLIYQQYQLLQPQSQDCKIDKYTLDLIAKHQVAEDKQVCIQPVNILKQGFADEYILIIKGQDSNLSKIYCVNNKCTGVPVQNKELAEILINPTDDKLTSYFSKH